MESSWKLVLDTIPLCHRERFLKVDKLLDIEQGWSLLHNYFIYAKPQTPEAIEFLISQGG
jgi:hypothetical protein